MARLFDDTQEEYLEIDQAVLSGTPLVMACWYNTDDVGSGQNPIVIADKDADDEYFGLVMAANSIIYAQTKHAVLDHAFTSTGCTVNTWHYICAIFATATDRRAFIDGGSKGTNATDLTPANLDRTCIGRYGIITPINYMSGKIAEVAIWDLSDWPGATDVDKADNFEASALPSLAKGFSPKFFSLGLKAYWPLIRDEDNDIIGGYNMTPVNTPSVGSHPRIIYPTASRIIQTPVVSGAADGGKFGILFELWGW